MQKEPEVITSRQNPLISLVCSLADRKHRRREGLFRFDGCKLFVEALQKALPLTAVLLRESSSAQIRHKVADLKFPEGCRVAVLPDSLFDRISEEKSPEGVICVSKSLDKLHKIVTIEKVSAALQPGRTLVLESVRDPGNLGTVIRTASAFGIANLLLSADCADIYHPRTIRGAMGTLFTRSILTVEDLPAAINVLRTRGTVFAAALDESATPLGSFSFGAEDSVVVGNEGHGLSAALLQAADRKLYIPMQPGVESLNAGIAASVLLWELYR